MLPIGIFASKRVRLLLACAFLNRPRAWLTAQATLALLLNHLLLTGW